MMKSYFSPQEKVISWYQRAMKSCFQAPSSVLSFPWYPRSPKSSTFMPSKRK